MPKIKISEYSATPSSNTDIDNIDINEGCSPSGINNAIRSLMSHLKNWQGGTSGDTLPIASGGTGSTSASAARTALGLAIGTDVQSYNASTAFTNATQTFTSRQTFTGSSSAISSKFNNALETITIAATVATGTINYDITTQSVLYYTANASANWTTNLRGNGTTTLNSLMATGEAITVVFLVTQGTTAFFNNVVQVDGSTVTPRWQNGSGPTAGNASSIDAYSYTIIKTGNAAFTVLASLVQFKA